MKRASLDLRGVACPMNLVRVKLALEPLAPGDELEVVLDPGEPSDNVSRAVVREGHGVRPSGAPGAGEARLVVRKAAPGR